MLHQDSSKIDYGTGEKTLSVYIIGIALCLILTVIPFLAVIYHDNLLGYVVPIIFLSAIAQLFVQVICFLRLNYSTPQSKLNVLSFIFCLLLLLILVFGSLWIMSNLNYNMMH